jgi:alkylhydroperoxidase/carboxymuconolactone decarboxylase family protein YurZ
MTPTEPVSQEVRSGRAMPWLEDLIPIAVVISAGCERCAQSMVQRALRRGGAQLLIERTLGIIEHVGSAECLAQAVGPDVIARMETSLRAARRALSEAGPSLEDRGCCG